MFVTSGEGGQNNIIFFRLLTTLNLAHKKAFVIEVLEIVIFTPLDIYKRGIKVSITAILLKKDGYQPNLKT